MKNLITLSETKALEKRKEFIEKFVNQSSNYFSIYIQDPFIYKKQGTYIGYLWDCLKEKVIIDYEKAMEFITKQDNIYIMWDINKYSKKRYDYFNDKLMSVGFPIQTIIQTSGKDYLINEKTFPEDIYIYDNNFKWTIALTHEYFDNKRFCLLCELK